jgi:hypothetical protein
MRQNNVRKGSSFFQASVFKYEWDKSACNINDFNAMVNRKAVHNNYRMWKQMPTVLRLWVKLATSINF